MKSTSKLPYETLKDFIHNMKAASLDAKYLAFLIDLQKIYIDCSRCKRKIAPDELYQLDFRDDPVCEECFAEESDITDVKDNPKLKKLLDESVILT